MKINRLGKVKKFLFDSRSYLLIFLIFTLVFIYGRNFNPSENKSAYVSKIEQLSRLSRGIYDLESGSNELVVDNVINTSPGINYRLFFDLSAEMNRPNVRKTDEKLLVEILLSNNLGDERLLQTFDIVSGQKELNVENIFYSDNYYQYLKLRKRDQKFQWSATISNISQFSLDIRDQSQLSSLKPSIKGITNFDQLVLSNDSESINAEFKFRRKNQKLGQIFTANSDVISGVELKMEVVGSGGLGNYQAELYEYNPGAGISTERIAYYEFDSKHAIKELASISGENVFRIPLVARLMKGKQYIFLISNQEVKFNPLNTLKIYGYKEQFGNHKMISMVGNNPKERSESMYFKIFSAKYQEHQRKIILTNAIVQDLGNGRGLYTYKQQGNFSDFLDIFETHDQSSSKSNVFYDNILQGVSAKDKDDTSMTYKFDTVYPFNKFSLSVEQPGDDFTDSKVFYSFDKTNWQDIDLKEENNAQSDKTGKFEKTVSGDGKQQEFYIKITYDEQSKKEKEGLTNIIEFFGIKNIIVAADLIIR